MIWGLSRGCRYTNTPNNTNFGVIVPLGAVGKFTNKRQLVRAPCVFIIITGFNKVYRVRLKNKSNSKRHVYLRTKITWFLTSRFFLSTCIQIHLSLVYVTKPEIWKLSLKKSKKLQILRDALTGLHLINQSSRTEKFCRQNNESKLDF